MLGRPPVSDCGPSSRDQKRRPPDRPAPRAPATTTAPPAPPGTPRARPSSVAPARHGQNRSCPRGPKRARCRPAREATPETRRTASACRPAGPPRTHPPGRDAPAPGTWRGPHGTPPRPTRTLIGSGTEELRLMLLCSRIGRFAARRPTRSSCSCERYRKVLGQAGGELTGQVVSELAPAWAKRAVLQRWAPLLGDGSEPAEPRTRTRPLP